MFEPLMQIVPLALLRRTRYHVGIDWLPDAIIVWYREVARAPTYLIMARRIPFPALSLFTKRAILRTLRGVRKKKKKKIPWRHSVF